MLSRKSSVYRLLNLAANGPQGLLLDPIQIDFEPSAGDTTMITASEHTHLHFWDPMGVRASSSGQGIVRQNIRRQVRIRPSSQIIEGKPRSRGKASFRTLYGDIEVDMKYGNTAYEDRPAVDLFLESGHGDITLRIPRSFGVTGNILVCSAHPMKLPSMEPNSCLGIVWKYESPWDLSYEKFYCDTLPGCGSNADIVALVALDGTVSIEYLD